MLEEPIADWLSIVNHGSNWTPFQMVVQKSDGTIGKEQGGEMPGAVIQSILLPGSKELDELAADPRYAWLRDMVAQVKKDNLAHTRFTFVDRKKFDLSSFRSAPLGDSGALVTLGELSDEAKQDETVVTTVTKAPADLVAAMQESQEDIIARLISDELWRFEDILFAAMRQTAAEPKKRKTTVMNALSALWDFLNNILDVAPATQMKIERPAATEPKTKATNPEDQTNPAPSVTDKGDNSTGASQNPETTDTTTQGDEMTPEEITALVAQEIKKSNDELMTRIEQKMDKPESEKPATLSDVVKSVTEIAGAVTGVAQSVAELKGEVAELKKGDKSADTDTDQPDANATDQPVTTNDVISLMKAQLDQLTHAVSGTPPPADPKVVRVDKNDPGSWEGMFGRRG